MILYLSSYCRKSIARFFIAIFYLSIATAAWGRHTEFAYRPFTPYGAYKAPKDREAAATKKKSHMPSTDRQQLVEPFTAAGNDIGGPSQPEMSSFKPVSANNLVNLFSGDFSYNIPLLDVGGYPVNIFYDANITPEQEASWVGLGWNINPGAVTRNMRGVPDDFDGSDIMQQTQAMKPNRTWGVNVGADFEILGIKKFFGGLLSQTTSTGFTAGLNLGVSFNNYLGPAIDFGVKGGYSFSIAKLGGSEKHSFGLGGGVGLNINNSSRNGVTIAPNFSLNASMQSKSYSISNGIGLSTSYNSRTGVRALQLSDQVSFSKQETKFSESKKGRGKYDFQTSSHGIGENIYSTSISFLKPSYMPAIRMPITNSSGAGHFQFGTAFWGAEVDLETEVFVQRSEIDPADRKQQKPLVGYLYYEKANNNPNSVLDFTRIGDKEVTPNTPIISAPQYTYDVFSINGEGTGGSIRPYRNDLGYVRDNLTQSKDKSFSAGADIAIPSHYGANFSTVKTPSTIGEWGDGNYLRDVIPFMEGSGSFQNVYFRNPGESSVLQPNQYAAIGGTDLVRYKLGGSGEIPTIEPILKRIDKTGAGASLSDVDLKGYNAAIKTADRKKRTQVTNFLTAKDAAQIGLDRSIKDYSQTSILNSDKILQFNEIPRSYPVEDDATGHYRKPHHISQINVMEADGKRYVYGIPVYNVTQTDFSFSVENHNNAQLVGDGEMVKYNLPDAGSNSPYLNPAGSNLVDGYVQSTTTPAYAHSFLLTGLLSPDYVDVGNDGITEDDMGTAVKFNYSKFDNFKWRTPHTGEQAIEGVSDGRANFNGGLRTSFKDDKGVIAYGVRESWYLHSIESKTMIALFKLGDRYDGKGAIGEGGGVSTTDHSIKRLKQIDLYSKADLKKNGLAHAKPIKTVHFEYSWELCKDTKDNPAGQEEMEENINGVPTTLTNQQGKLTLKKIYFTFNGQKRANKSQYVFGYGDLTPNSVDNPSYARNVSDRWGNYKTSADQGGLNNTDYPYSTQVSTTVTKETIDQNASAWCLKKILLPSGGLIEVDYQSDDYAFVQNKRASVMTKIVGFTHDPAITPTNELYSLFPTSYGENLYVVVNIPVCKDANNNTCTYTLEQVRQQLLDGQSQLAFRLAVAMPKGYEYLTAYADIDNIGFMPSSNTQVWIKMKPAGDDDLSPLSLTSIEFLREQLPAQAYPAYDVSGESSLEQIGTMLIGMLEGLTEIFKDQVNHLRSKRYARLVDLEKSFVRLNQIKGYKLGGGNRVKEVRIRNNWNKMTEKKDGSGTVIVPAEAESIYGQKYDYGTKEIIAGQERNISSGVASYEPSIGSEENPFQTIMRIPNAVPMGPTSYGSIELPFLDALFPSPSVGYSKVTVRSYKNTTSPTRSGIGKQVTEFHTSKDYPVKWYYTSLDYESQKEEHSNSTAFFWKNAFDARALTQGFLVELNDMNGKMKSQASYPENDENTPVNFTQNYYRNIGDKGLNETFSFLHTSSSGGVAQGNMGIDIELMTDTREFKVESISKEAQAQVDFFATLPPFWVPTIWPVWGNSENTYRAVTCTKVVNYHSVVDKVVMVDKGSMVSTENQVFDAETGQVIVNKTNNEYNRPIYSTNYPAYWAYSGMGLAYKNIDAVFTDVNFLDGVITGGSNNLPGIMNTLFESGDEIYIVNDGTAPGTGCGNVLAGLNASNPKLLWAFDKDKNYSTTTDINISALTNPTPDFVFIDKQGVPFTRNGVTIRIVRSGKRNMLEASLASATSMQNPIVSNLLTLSSSSKVVNASAVEYREKWQTDNDIIQRIKWVYNPENCSTDAIVDCEGLADLEKSINPYLKGLLGTFRNWRSKLLYTDRVQQHAVNSSGQPEKTRLPEDGFVDAFTPYWTFNSLHNLIPDLTTTTGAKWVWNSQATRINANGMELETKDALGIYTGAQYGYSKAAPVAITSNSTSNEMGFEGFDDQDYAAVLNPSTAANCAINRHFNLLSIPTTTVIDAGAASINAHTGKKVLSVPASTNNGSINYTANFAVVDDVVGEEPKPVHTFPLVLQSGVTQNLSDPGVNVTDIVSSPPGQPYLLDPAYIGISGFNSNGGFLMQTTHYHDLPTGIPHGSQLTYKTDHYFKIENEGMHEVVLAMWTEGSFAPNSHGGSAIAKIYDESNSLVVELSTTTLAGYPDPYGTKTICLKKGIYHMVSSTYTEVIVTDVNASTDYTAYIDYGFSVNKVVSPTSIEPYKSTTTVDGCTYQKPIYGETSMLNPTSTFKNNKKMLFSAWVRENCSIPCTTYINSGVELVFEDINGDVIDANGAAAGTNIAIPPSGNIIEGWQKVEGDFIIPSNAVKMKVALKNGSSTLANYWDDIRVHPFNANMKSYVYDPINLRLVAELDANNYASFYEYDDEGTPIRAKAETKEGIKTIKETRSAKQKKITDLP
jgi:hypothetical protein